MKRAILALLVMLVWVMPARAMTITYTDRDTASFSYTPVTDGIASMSWAFTYHTIPILAPTQPAAVILQICGDTQAWAQLCMPQGFSSSVVWYTCVTDALCSFSGNYSMSILGNGLVSFLVSGGGGILISSTITFAGPDAEVPLPATLPLFAVALAATGLFGWRKRATKTADRTISR